MKTIGIFLKYEVIGEGEEGKHRVFFMNRFYLRISGA
jgi:hypothetical protein